MTPRLSARTVLVFLTMSCHIAWPAFAGPMGGGPHAGMGRFGKPAFLQHVFRPDLIMRHQQEIGLTETQRRTITTAMRSTHDIMVDLRWQFEAKSQELAMLLRMERIDEAAAITLAEEVMRVEQLMKKTHLQLLIQIKNQLTAAQQEQLKALRPPTPPHPPRHP